MPFNQPKLCPNATWNPFAVTLANSSNVGTEPQAIFVDTDNTVYTVDFQNGTINMWTEGSTTPTGTIMTNYYHSKALFVSMTGDVYIDVGNYNDRLGVWRENSTNSVSSLYTGSQCYSLFLASNDSLYCSMHGSHQVIKRSLNSSDNHVTIVAGTGCSGYLPHTLYYQHGIFVTSHLDLYVADTNNHRIQLFKSGQLNATTIAGAEVVGSVVLRYPAAVMLDGDGYLFILDSGNVRVVGSGPYGFRCVIGCTNGWGPASDQLAFPQSMAFDNNGNIFITDTRNDRVQKFLRLPNTCSKYSAVTTMRVRNREGVVHVGIYSHAFLYNQQGKGIIHSV